MKLLEVYIGWATLKSLLRNYMYICLNYQDIYKIDIMHSIFLWLAVELRLLYISFAGKAWEQL